MILMDVVDGEMMKMKEEEREERGEGRCDTPRGGSA